MAAGNWIQYGHATNEVMDNNINLDLGAFRVVLLKNSYVPSQDNHTAWSDLSGEEVDDGGGYLSSGVLMANPETARAAATTAWDGDDVQWAASTITAKYAAVVHDADANGTLVAGDVPICYCDLDTGGGDVSSVAANFDITMNVAGVTKYVNAAA